jgi:RNA polymerase sigma factor (sigma-70 family)
MQPLVHELVGHYADLRRHLMRELRDHAHAEDIAQSSFERVYVQALAADSPAGVNASLESGISSLRALLFRVARNLSVDAARHRKVVQVWATDKAGMDAHRAAPSSEFVVAQMQVLQKVVETLEAVPPRRREVFLLSRAYGYSHAEIAQRLGITEMAVAKHLVRVVVDCSKIFLELRAQLPELSPLASQRTFKASLAEEHS